MASKRLLEKLPVIEAFFAKAIGRVYRQKDIAALLAEHHSAWGVRQETTTPKFIATLMEHSKLRCYRFDFPYRPETLFTWGEVSRYVLAASAKPGAYLCHQTAMRLHELTSKKTSILYANQEQRQTSSFDSPPTQASVDSAFRRPQRMTSNLAKFGRAKLCVVNGKNTGRLGVMEMVDENGVPFHVTDLERTLIDVTVRPAYAGGISEVLAAYRKAAGRLDVSKLATMLADLEFVYPYRQAIGFCLDRSEKYQNHELDFFRKPPFELDFYLAHGMPKTHYSAAWRIRYPADLDGALSDRQESSP